MCVIYYPIMQYMSIYCKITGMIENRLSMIMGMKRLKPKDILSITNISRKTLYNIYHDKTKGIEFEILNQLCFALDCTPNDLFKYIPD